MFWWFERGGHYLRCESIPTSAGGFELRLVQPDGTERIEQFSDSDSMAQRQGEVFEEIAQAGWHGPHGWNL
jgi:hypothetical protein